jgi:hypothetical protein
VESPPPVARAADGRNPFARLPDYFLIFLAIFAFAWAVARACIQAVTGDEGESYVLWVADPHISYWYPAPNNHILNSLLEWVFTSIFGLSHLTVRIPALIGAALFIGISLCFTKLLTRDWIIRIPLFICLVYNPFVFDFFVAARGYGLATAFLLCAIAAPVWIYLRVPNSASGLMVASALSSACIALSFTANFSFALADLGALLLLILLALHTAKQLQTPAPRPMYWRIAAAGLVPGALVVLLLPAWTLLHWQPGMLFDGGTSLGEMLKTVFEASLFQLNSHFANPIVLPVMSKIRRFLFPAACAIAVIQLGLILANRRKALDERARKLLTIGALCVGTIVIAMLLHQIAYWLFHLLMPRNRTAMFVAPLVTIAIGAVASIRPYSSSSRVLRRALVLTLSLTALYFLLCLRLTYFREWQYQQDVQRGYDVLAWYNHNRAIDNVEVSWYYYGAFRFYQTLSGREHFASLTNSGNFTHPLDKQLYVLNGVFERDFISAQKLTIVYRAPNSDLVVALPAK